MAYQPRNPMHLHFPPAKSTGKPDLIAPVCVDGKPHKFTDWDTKLEVSLCRKCGVSARELNNFAARRSPRVRELEELAYEPV